MSSKKSGPGPVDREWIRFRRFIFAKTLISSPSRFAGSQFIILDSITEGKCHAILSESKENQKLLTLDDELVE